MNLRAQLVFVIRCGASNLLVPSHVKLACLVILIMYVLKGNKILSLSLFHFTCQYCTSKPSPRGITGNGLWNSEEFLRCSHRRPKLGIRFIGVDIVHYLKMVLNGPSPSNLRNRVKLSHKVARNVSQHTLYGVSISTSILQLYTLQISLDKANASFRHGRSSGGEITL